MTGPTVIAVALPPDERAAVHEQLSGAGLEPIAVANAAQLEGFAPRPARVRPPARDPGGAPPH